VPPQLVATLRGSGYRTAFFSSASVRWQRMDEYLSEAYFDHLDIHAAPEVDRPDRDREMFDRAVRFLGERSGQPAFAMVFPMATHYLYKYPPEYERHRPVVETWAWVRAFQRGTPPPEVVVGTVNRYRNALAFLDDRIADIVESLDPTRHVIILTGDHGESFLDDGTWFHLGPLSEIQTRVPFVVWGAGAPNRAIGRGTTHVDVLPTLLHLLAGEPVAVDHSHGRDLLARDWPDHVLLAKPAAAAESEVVLIRDQARLAFRLGL
jgi:membrane-anchored protein YejM (alkaline phosphatase superfamily)